MKKALLGFLLVAFFTLPGRCCTSVIISARASGTGRPVMLKHRDSGHPDNRIDRFRGPKYAFIGLVNADVDDGVWSGMNDAGFCIMNTAAYNFKDDDVPDEQMDREGLVMKGALGVCRTVDEFEAYLAALSVPRGVEANFGVIDAFGGAAYFEANNHRYIRHDVADDPRGWMVVTNWCASGREEPRYGVDRAEKATAVIAARYADGNLPEIDAAFLVRNISRSGAPILRPITTAVTVFEGVAPGGDPSHCVMWTVLGYPTAAPLIPLLVDGAIPEEMGAGADGKASLCTKALAVKEEGKDESARLELVESECIPAFRALLRRREEGRIRPKAFQKRFIALQEKACNW